MVVSGQIESLFARDVRRQIEEVIKLHQMDEAIVAAELDEYVTTPAIKTAYTRILERYVQTPLKPHEGIGIWVSGFFGSGKSSFAKYLGLALADRQLLGVSAADRLADRLADDRVRALLGRARREAPTLVVSFDMGEDPLVRSGEEKISLVAYRALLRILGYSDDPDLAELEISLEQDGKLEEFERLYQETFGRPWTEGRARIALAIGEASRILHLLDSHTYPSPDSWLRSDKRIDFSARDIAERTLLLARRRCPHVRMVMFVADEVGQYIARSTDKMLDVQGLVQALGHVGQGRAWFVATSQEKLDSLVSYLDERRVELGRVRDRFPRELEVDLAPGDIVEVTSRRILAKKPELRAEIERLHDQHAAELQVNTRLTSLLYAATADRTTFVNLYPFLSYQIDLLIRIVGGMRGRHAAGLQTGGAIRTMVKLAQQVLIHEQTSLATRTVGHLVTLDMFYPLLEGLIASEKRNDIDQVDKTFGATSIEGKVARAIALMEYVQDPARSAENLAALLYPALGTASVRLQVEQALEQLLKARVLQSTEEGYSLLTVAAKNWEEERNKQEVHLGDIRRIEHNALAKIAQELPGYELDGQREFRPQVVFEGSVLSKGNVEVRLFLVDEKDFGAEREAKRQASRDSGNEDVLFWIAPLSGEVQTLEREVALSDKIIRERDRPQVKGEEADLLNRERTKLTKNEAKLYTALCTALLGGECYFRGGAHVPGAGVDLAHGLRNVLGETVPKIYERFRVAAARRRGDEAVKLVEDADLSGVPQVLCAGAGGLGLVEVQGSQRRINGRHEGVEAVCQFVRRKQQYGERTTGQALEHEFGRPPYGWDGDAIRLFVAAAFRLGHLEIKYGNQWLRRRDDPGVRDVFGKTPAFRASAFQLREPLGLGILMAAVGTVERLFGCSVQPEEAVIAEVVRKRLPAEREQAVRVVGILQTAGLPGAERAAEMERTYGGFMTSSDEEVVRTLAAQGQSLQEDREWMQVMAQALSQGNLATLRRARRAANELGKELAADGVDDPSVTEAVARISAALANDNFCSLLDQLGTDARYLEERHRARYEEVARALADSVEKAMDEVYAHPRWPELPDASQHAVVAPLRGLLPATEEVPEKMAWRVHTLRELRLRLQTVPAAKEQVLSDLHRTLVPAGQRVERIRLTKVVGREVSSAEEVELVVNRLREALLRLVAEGVRVLLE